MTQQDIARFENKIDKSGDCWEWTACTTINGYGHFGLNGKLHHAQRIAYELYIGPIPEGMDVLHTCDNRKCVNPKHLWIGTHADNMADMKAKGRGRGKLQWGETNSSAKLTECDVRMIRELRKRLVPVLWLADWFGVRDSCISRVANGKRWSHIALG